MRRDSQHTTDAGLLTAQSTQTITQADDDYLGMLTGKKAEVLSLLS
jgi:hypothetical protein